MDNKQDNLGWGKTNQDGSEIWDSEPVFLNDQVELKDKLKLLFYPKKFFLYRYILNHAKEELRVNTDIKEPYKVLDVGCGTGASVIDLKKMLGRRAEVIGVEVVNLQVGLAKEKIKKNAVHADVMLYDGIHLPFENRHFDAVYTSDVLGHVKDVRSWLAELSRVTKPGGVLAIFSESSLEKHAWIRNYLFKRGLNVDPHAESHISLFPKSMLKEFVESSGFSVSKMRALFWASFLVHPDEFFSKLQAHKGFFFLRTVNKILYWIKKKTHPYSTAFCELYGLVEALLLGKWVRAQGYIILARKK